MIWSRGLGVLPLVAILFLAPLSGAQDFAEIRKNLTDGDRETRRAAALELRELGAAAAPCLPELIDALKDDDEQVAGRAMTAIAAIGPNAPDAIPALIEQLDPQRRRYDEQVVYRAAFALSEIGTVAVNPLRHALINSSDERRFGAAQALQLIGADAAPAIPDLIIALHDDEREVRETAAEALAAIGEKSLGPLQAEVGKKTSVAAIQALGFMGGMAAGAGDQLLALKVDEGSLRSAVISSLGLIGVPFEKLREPLRAALLDESDEVRLAAANTLLMRDESLPALEAWLGDEDRKMRQRAAWVVGQFGADAAALAPSLIAQLERGDDAEILVKALTGLGAEATESILEAVGKKSLTDLRGGEGRHWAIAVLESAGPLAMPKLESALSSDSAATRYVALGSLAKLGSVAKPLEGKFRKATGDGEPAVRLAGLIALEACGADRKRLATILHRRCADESGEVRAVAVRLLGELGGEDREAFTLVDGALSDADRNVQRAAIGALGNFGSEAEASVPKLLELSKSGDADTRLGILRALAEIGSGASDALPLVRKALEASGAETRGAAIRALVAIEPDGESLTEVLSKMLADKDKAVRHPAIEGLGRRGESAASAAPQLFKLLENGDDRMEALEALRRIRSRDVDLYIGALESKEPRVRLFACEALGRLGKDAEKAIPQLEKARRDRYDFVRRRAGDAIKRIRR